MASTASSTRPHSAAPAVHNGRAIPQRSGQTPLGAVLAFTFLNSIGSGVVTTGFSFLADSAYGFTAGQNYWLGFLQGAVYIVGALAVGPALARAIRTIPGVSTRRMLIALMSALALLCALPWLARVMGIEGKGWALWTLIAGYSTLTGTLWPIVESYMSGGRSETRLRSAIGFFNVTWSSALVVAYWIMGPLKTNYALELVLGVSAIHLLSLLLLPLFTTNPAAHSHEDHAPAPPVYSQLLTVFRMQLVTSYLVYAALTPFLPLACRTLKLPEQWHTPIVATWLATRVLAFAGLQRWHGWHGRWGTTGWGAGFLLLGFGGAVLSTIAGARFGSDVGLAFLIAGLGVFGIGMGVIYTAALYYAMAAGNAQVDAGGKHEAMIGLGYGGGPILGLLALGAGDLGLLREGGALHALTGGEFQVLMLVLVAIVSCGIIGWSLMRARMNSTLTSSSSTHA